MKKKLRMLFPFATIIIYFLNAATSYAEGKLVRTLVFHGEAQDKGAARTPTFFLKDLNHDGSSDAIMRSFTSGNIQVAQGAPNNNFNAQRIVSTTDLESNISFCDLNGDGLPDLVEIQSKIFDRTNDHARDNRVVVHLNNSANGSISFSGDVIDQQLPPLLEFIKTEQPVSSTNITCADLRGTGKQSLIAIGDLDQDSSVPPKKFGFREVSLAADGVLTSSQLINLENLATNARLFGCYDTIAGTPGGCLYGVDSGIFLLRLDNGVAVTKKIDDLRSGRVGAEIENSLLTMKDSNTVVLMTEGYHEHYLTGRLERVTELDTNTLKTKARWSIFHQKQFRFVPDLDGDKQLDVMNFQYRSPLASLIWFTGSKVGPEAKRLPYFCELGTQQGIVLDMSLGFTKPEGSNKNVALFSCRGDTMLGHPIAPPSLYVGVLKK